jgi:hypothetical protein
MAMHGKMEGRKAFASIEGNDDPGTSAIFAKIVPLTNGHGVASVLWCGVASVMVVLGLGRVCVVES